MVVLAVPLIGVGFAAAWTDELLDPRVAAGPVAPVTRMQSAGDTAIAMPLARLLTALSPPPAATAPRTAAAPAVRRRPSLHQVPVAVPPGGRPVARRNRLVSADGTLDAPVGIYTDCTGRSPLSRAEAAIDTCYWNPAYFVGHNLGVFSPLMHMGVGSLITYYDADGRAHLWRVVFVHDGWPIGPGRPTPAGSDVVAQFQTCASGDRSLGRVLDVVDA